MFYRQHKTFWYKFCNLKHFLKAENSEDIFASSCEQNSVTCHVTQSGTDRLSYYWNYAVTIGTTSRYCWLYFKTTLSTLGSRVWGKGDCGPFESPGRLVPSGTLVSIIEEEDLHMGIFGHLFEASLSNHIWFVIDNCPMSYYVFWVN